MSSGPLLGPLNLPFLPPLGEMEGMRGGMGTGDIRGKYVTLIAASST
jgi:hypothetical protein